MTLYPIAIVGEAWGEHEARVRAPFVGPSGYELTRMLTEAGIRRRDCWLTNVFNLRPENNDVSTLCREPFVPDLPPLAKGKRLSQDYLSELNRLMSELRSIEPNVVLALGNTATWALLRATAISKIRGTIAPSPVLTRSNGTPIKILPAYHPAAILRQWELRPVTVLDFFKAKRESTFPEIRRPHREIWIEPSLRDIQLFAETYLLRASEIAVDIETDRVEVTCIGFAPDKSRALVIPFQDLRKPDANYWPSHEEEREAWEWVRRILLTPARKIFQNGLYDMNILWRRCGLRVRNAADDTMLMHHALQPESEKSLGFLGSVYTNEASWKLLRQSKIQQKRDK